MTVCLCHPTRSNAITTFCTVTASSSIFLPNLATPNHVCTCTCMLKDLGTLSISSLKKSSSLARKGSQEKMLRTELESPPFEKYLWTSILCASTPECRFQVCVHHTTIIIIM